MSDKKFYPQEWLIKEYSNEWEEPGIKIIEHQHYIEICSYVEGCMGEDITDRIFLEKADIDNLYRYLGEIKEVDSDG